jgi:hypothetical protein
MIQYHAEVTCDECEAKEFFDGTFGFVSARNAGWLMLAGQHLCPVCQVVTPKVTPEQGRYFCERGSYPVGDMVYLPEPTEGRVVAGKAGLFPIHSPVFAPVYTHIGRVTKEEEACGGFTRMKRRFGHAVATGRSVCASWIGRLTSALRD